MKKKIYAQNLQNPELLEGRRWFWVHRLDPIPDRSNPIAHDTTTSSNTLVDYLLDLA